MAEIFSWSRFAADNILPSPDGWLEHIPAGANNDIAREMMAAIARHRDAVHGYPLSTGAEANVYNITVPQDVPYLFHGLRASFTAHRDSVDGAATLRLNSASSRNLVGISESGLGAGELRAGRPYDIVYSGSRFQLIDPSVMNSSGRVRLNTLPTFLGGKSASTVDGFSVSTAATGTDANTLYFRSTGIFHGSDEITSLVAGGETINEVSVGSTVVYALPKTPTNFRARRSNNVLGGLDLSWTNASAPTLDSVLTYRLERALNAAFTDTLTTVVSAQVGSDTTYLDSDITGSPSFPTYYYRLRAETSFGVTGYVELNRNARLQAPAAPFESLTYTLVSGSGTYPDVQLRWTQPEGGDYATRYSVERTHNNILSTPSGTITNTNNISPGIAGYTDTTVNSAPGNSASYRVQARNDVSVGADLFSNTVVISF